MKVGDKLPDFNGARVLRQYDLPGKGVDHLKARSVQELDTTGSGKVDAYLLEKRFENGWGPAQSIVTLLRVNDQNRLTERADAFVDGREIIRRETIDWNANGQGISTKTGDYFAGTALSPVRTEVRQAEAVEAPPG